MLARPPCVPTSPACARFSIADGKVCLSLLGTFHGSNAAEKWNPKDSSLYQILLSVQGLILIEVGGGGRAGERSPKNSP